MILEKELTVKRNNNFYLDSNSYQVLRMLYKGITGFFSINLYETLYDLSFKNSSISYLLLSDRLHTEFKEPDLAISLDKLKELKLIKYKSDNIEIYPPLNKMEFKDSILLEYLKNLVSKEEYEFIMNSVYYEVLNPSINNKIDYKIIKKMKLPFDFQSLVAEFNDDSILEYENEITGAANMYNLGLEDVLRLLYEMDTFDLDTFIDLLNNRYNNKKSLSKDIKESDIDIIEYFKSYDPLKALSFGGRSVSMSDKKTIERLKQETSLSDDLISLLVIYSLVTNKYKLYPFRFYEVIVKDWANKSIDNLNEAYNYIDTLYIKNGNRKNTNDESWFSDYLKELREKEND